MPLEESGPYSANIPLGRVVFGPMKGKPSKSHLCLSVQSKQKVYNFMASYFETENFGAKVLPVIESNEVS